MALVDTQTVGHGACVLAAEPAPLVGCLVLLFPKSRLIGSTYRKGFHIDR